MQKLAIYDMDKTITREATFIHFLTHAMPRIAPWRLIFLPAMGVTSLGYLFGLLDRAKLKQLNLRVMLGKKINIEKLTKASKSFAQQTFKYNLLPGARESIRQDVAQGYRPVIASASYAFYVEKIGVTLGIFDIIATQATEADHAISSKISGENCYGEAKLAMVKDWLAEQGIDRSSAHIRFYSDHVSDAPCLEWADEAFATNPHPPLRTLAQAKGWAIKDWV